MDNLEPEQNASPKDHLSEMEEAYQKELTRPFTQDDFPNMPQLHIDAINVMEKRIDISTFPESYQQQIKNAYRFVPINVDSSNAGASQAGRGFWK